MATGETHIFFQPAVNAAVDSSVEIRGTDTPPEKVPRQFFPANFKANEETRGGDSSLFSSIMHKFVKVDNRQDINRRYFPFLKCLAHFSVTV